MGIHVSVQVGIYLPCYDVFRNWLEDLTTRNAPFATPYVPLVAGSLARSLACATCYPIELARTRMQVIMFNVDFYFIIIIFLGSMFRGDDPEFINFSWVMILVAWAPS